MLSLPLPQALSAVSAAYVHMGMAGALHWSSGNYQLAWFFVPSYESAGQLIKVGEGLSSPAAMLGSGLTVCQAFV